MSWLTSGAPSNKGGKIQKTPRVEKDVTFWKSLQTLFPDQQEVTTSATSSIHGRLHFLDALRGLAALYVVLFHMVAIPNPNLATPNWLYRFAHTGGMGVSLFFVVSAFSLFYTMPFRLAKPKPIASFYLHRLFRIAPLFYVIIALTVIRDHIIFDATHTWGEIASSLLFVFNLIPRHEEGFVWASWSISVEMLFYVVFPLIYLRTKTIYMSITWLFGFLLLWQLAKIGIAYLPLTEADRSSMISHLFLKNLPIFACGILAYLMIRDRGAKSTVAYEHEKGYALLLIGTFGYIGFLKHWLPNIFGDHYYWQGVISATILVGLCYAPMKLFVNRFTEYLGRISYSMYLLHPTIIYLLKPLYRQIYQVIPFTTISLAICLALTLAIVIAISEVTFRLIEEPGIKLGSYIYRRFYYGTRVTET